MTPRKPDHRDHLDTAEPPPAGGRVASRGRRRGGRADPRAQTLEVVERLVSGVAHEFNNLLTVLAGNTDLLLESRPLEPDARELIEEIRTVAVRAASLTQRLVTIAARQGGDVTRFDFRHVLHAIQPLLRRAYPAAITLDFERSATPLPVQGDPGLLELGLMTLAIGLRDAMRAGGAVRFQLSQTLVPRDGMPECPGLDPGPHVVLGVAESAAALTDAAGHVDLALLESAVKLSRGCLLITRQDDGATLTMYLPVAAEAELLGTEAVDLDG